MLPAGLYLSRLHSSELIAACFGALPHPNDGVAEVLPIAIAPSPLVEVDVPDFSHPGILHSHGGQIVFDVLSTLIALFRFEHVLASIASPICFDEGAGRLRRAD